MRAILCTNHQTILCTISCQRWIAIKFRIDFFYTLFTNGCNGCMIEIKNPKHLVQKSCNLTQLIHRIGHESAFDLVH
jgi:hypothetical protein